MRLSEFKDEQALDVFVELIEPVSRILADPEVAKAAKGGNKIAAIKAAIKTHKKDVMTALALMEGVPVAEYHCGVLSLPVKLLEILNDPDVMQLFTYAGQTMGGTSSGSDMASTVGGER